MTEKNYLEISLIRFRNYIINRYLGRRIPRSESAKRYSNIEKNYLKRVVLDKFFDNVFFDKKGTCSCWMGTYSLNSCF
jgi:hypothetical protein